MVPDGSKPLILPSVWLAITRLIAVRVASGAARKSAAANVTASCSRASNAALTGSPDWIHTVFGARNVADPPPGVSVSRSPAAAASCGWGSSSRCSTWASSAAVWPRAPHSAMRSALATLAGEKTVSVASSVRIWNRSAPSAASAAAGTFRTVRTYPPRMKAWPDGLVHDRGYQTVPERGGGVPARRSGQEHGDPDRDRGSQGQGGRGRGAVRLVATRRGAGRGRVHAHAGLPPPALPGERPGRHPAGRGSHRGPPPGPRRQRRPGGGRRVRGGLAGPHRGRG